MTGQGDMTDESRHDSLPPSGYLPALIQMLMLWMMREQAGQAA